MTASPAPAPLKAPFPWFGGKKKAAPLIWQALGNPLQYIEPFAGSLAVLLARPHPPRREVANDLDGMISNAWRSIQSDPDEVVYHARNAVREVDLHARHMYLVRAKKDLTERLMGDPDFCDHRLAGWWLWGAGVWLGDGWCSGRGPWTEEDGVLVKRPGAGEIQWKVPKDRPGGVSSLTVDKKELQDWIRLLSNRLYRTVITCGSWERVLGAHVRTFESGSGGVGILLDPPYADPHCSTNVYGHPDGSAAADAWAWALENGHRPGLRIVYCAYEDGRDLPEGWTRVAWSAPSGYARNVNRHREILYLSPHSLPVAPA